MKIQSCSQLISFKRLKNYHFASGRENSDHIVRSVKAAGFPETLLVPNVRIFTIGS